jgi:hypothetical protein
MWYRVWGSFPQSSNPNATIEASLRLNAQSDILSSAIIVDVDTPLQSGHHFRGSRLRVRELHAKLHLRGIPQGVREVNQGGHLENESNTEVEKNRNRHCAMAVISLSAKLTTISSLG